MGERSKSKKFQFKTTGLHHHLTKYLELVFQDILTFVLWLSYQRLIEWLNRKKGYRPISGVKIQRCSTQDRISIKYLLDNFYDILATHSSLSYITVTKKYLWMTSQNIGLITSTH